MNCRTVRQVARLTVASFDWEQNPALKVRVRKTLRLLVLYFFVVIEYFQVRARRPWPFMLWST